MASLDAGTMEFVIITGAVTATAILNHKGLGFAIHALHASSTVASANRRVQGSGRSFMKGKTDGCVSFGGGSGGCGQTRRAMQKLTQHHAGAVLAGAQGVLCS